MKVKIRARENVYFEKIVDIKEEEFDRLNNIEDDDELSQELDMYIDRQNDIVDTDALDPLGITNDEREELGALYSPGKSLWRVQLGHLSTYDCNWPYGPPDDATSPPSPDDDDSDEDLLLGLHLVLSPSGTSRRGLPSS